MGKALDNRQRVKNPRKRDRYTPPKKDAAPPPGRSRRKPYGQR